MGSVAADLTGTKVEEYEVVSQLGGGGMGVVYEGRASGGRRVAIKTLKAAFAQDPEVVGRFLNEARALKAISHKALVEIFSIGQLSDGTHYFVMEFLEGKTFEDVIAHGAPLETREVLPWLCEILDALEVVHAHGVIHRDLKPSNLFLARTGVGPQVKLIDFGVAKHTGKSQRNPHHTAVSAIVGTPDYMSPEQVSGDPVTAASDLYALGCVMYEMLTGELPFADDSEVKKMMMHIERPAPVPSTLVPAVPKGVDEVVAWMLQKDPANRPPSAIALKRRLETLMVELGESGPRATMQVPIVRPSPPSVTEPELKQLDWPKTALVEGDKTTPMKPTRKRRTASAPVTAGPGLVPRLWWLAAGALALVGGTALGWRLTRPKPSETPPAVVAQPDKPAPDKTPEAPQTSTETTADNTTPAPPPAPPPLPKKRHPTATTPPKKRPKGTHR